MGRPLAAVLGVFVVLVGESQVPAALQQRTGDGGWTFLFDGKDLDRWTPIGDVNWKVAAGAAEASIGAPFTSLSRRLRCVA